MSAFPRVPALAAHGELALSLEELEAWGESFGRSSEPPLVVALSGDLGAGKTTLARAICRGYGVTEPVTSPTFAIAHVYRGARSAVHHLDLYRLARPTELHGIGWDEIVGAHALVIIEWPERAGDLLPANHVSIALAHHPTRDDRRLLLAG